MKGGNMSEPVINTYYVNFSVWDHVEAKSREEAVAIVKDRIKHLHNELVKADLDGSDIYNEDSEDYIFNSA